jgi:hypothetical protein
MFLRSTYFMGFCADMYRVAQVVHHVPAQYEHLIWDSAQICTAWPRQYTMFLRSTSFIWFCADMDHVAQVVHHVPAQYVIL